MTDMITAFVKYWGRGKMLNADEARLCNLFEEALIEFLHPMFDDDDMKKIVQKRIDKYLENKR